MNLDMQQELSTKLVCPNPFQPNGIEFELSENALVTVTILDESGHDVETLLENQYCTAGKQVIPFDRSKYATRGHAYQVIADIDGSKVVETKRLG